MSGPLETTVFTPSFLDQRKQRDQDSATAPEANYAGPWHAIEQDRGFAVCQESDQGPAEILFRDRELALLVAAICPALGRTRRLSLRERDQPAPGFDVQTVTGGRLETVGWLRYDHPELLDALHVVEWLLRSPRSLALLLEAASGDVLARAGKILASDTLSDIAPEP